MQAEAPGYLTVEADGSVKGQPARLQARVPVQFGRGDGSELSGSVQVGKTAVSFDGTVGELSTFDAVDGRMELRGDSLDQLRVLAGLNVPATPPYRLKGHLRHVDSEWMLEDLEGRVGDSDLKGRATLSLSVRPIVRAELVSDKLDFDDLGPLIGLPPRTGPGETASAAQRREARRLERADRALPDEPFHVATWDRFDADVSLNARRVEHPPALLIEALDARLQLREGVLTLKPLKLALAGAQAIADVELDGRTAPLQARANVQFRGLRLNGAFPTVSAMRSARGVVHGRLDLSGHGASVADLLAHANGRVALALEGGMMSNLVLEEIGLDGGEVLKFLATGDRNIPVRCGVTDLAVRDGRAQTEALVLDTTDTVIVGSGTVDLATERIDLKFHPYPKDPSLLAARSPLLLRGSFRSPYVGPDPSPIVARAASSVLMGLLNPLLALVPFIETGPGKDSECGRLLTEVRRQDTHSRSHVGS